MIHLHTYPRLLVDAGNTRAKFRYFTRPDTYMDIVVDDDCRAEIPTGWNPVITMISASGALPFPLKDRWPQCRMIDFSAGLSAEIHWAYESPKQLGRDRAAAMLALKNRFPDENVILVSAGTCLTIDFLSAQAIHLGGYISPGLQMRLQAMHAFTHALPRAQISDLKEEGPGTDTHSCLAGGAYWGMVAEIEYHAAKNVFGEIPFRMVLTGGDAVFLARFLKPATFVAPDLIFEGLMTVLDRLGLD